MSVPLITAQSVGKIREFYRVGARETLQMASDASRALVSVGRAGLTLHDPDTGAAHGVMHFPERAADVAVSRQARLMVVVAGRFILASELPRFRLVRQKVMRQPQELVALSGDGQTLATAERFDEFKRLVRIWLSCPGGGPARPGAS